MQRNIEERYYKYLTDKICDLDHPRHIYSKLLKTLNSIEFYAVMEMDNNRIVHAFDTRLEYEERTGCEQINGPVSVLEVMITLAIRCEDTIMHDSEIGDRTSKWFWYMVYSMGLIDEINSDFDEAYVIDCIYKMLNREYDRDGCGGLFYIPGCILDLRTIEIWYQMHQYLETFE